MLDPKSIEATRAAQAILSSVRPSFRVDGHWGSFTESTFRGVPVSTQNAIVAALHSYGTSPEQLKAAFDAERLSPLKQSTETSRKTLERRGGAARPDVAAAIAHAAVVSGVPASTLAVMASIESGGNPSAVNGSSRGLFQMQPASWAEASEWLLKKGINIGSWADRVLDAESNAMAAAAYFQLNSSRLRSLGFTDPVTPAVLYVAHQQGAAGFMELWKTSKGMPVHTHWVTPEKMSGNKPQDGGPPTTDKKEFFTRWMAVAQRKFG